MNTLFLPSLILALVLSPLSFGYTISIASPVGSTAEGIPIKLRQATINALLVREITPNNYGATVSKFTASVLPSTSSNSSAGMKTRIEQRVGESMITSFSAVNKGLFLKYNAWPKGETLTLNFADKHGATDGPSAAVAYSLLLESLISGKALKSDLACTGDMNSDRSVQPIGGVLDKIRAAKKEGCNYVLIPEKNVPQIMDAVIDGEIELLTSIQVIAVKDFDQAQQVAFEETDEEIKNALAAYAKVQKVVKSKGVNILKNTKVFEQVKITGKAISNHQSARIAAYYKLNRMPKTYTVIGSFTRLDKAVSSFSEKEHRIGSVKKYAQNDAHKEAMSKLFAIKNKLHPKVQPFASKVVEYIRVHREIVTKRDGSHISRDLDEKFKKALTAVKQERKKMYEDPDIKDTLAE